MKRIRMSIDQIRDEQRDIYGDEVDTMGIMALVDVENMGWCKDGVTRWYTFENANGDPAIYYKY